MSGELLPKQLLLEPRLQVQGQLQLSLKNCHQVKELEAERFLRKVHTFQELQQNQLIKDQQIEMDPVQLL
jgi:hypothetical protein